MKTRILFLCTALFTAAHVSSAEEAERAAETKRRVQDYTGRVTMHEVDIGLVPEKPGEGDRIDIRRPAAPAGFESSEPVMPAIQPYTPAITPPPEKRKAEKNWLVISTEGDEAKTAEPVESGWGWLADSVIARQEALAKEAEGEEAQNGSEWESGESLTRSADDGMSITGEGYDGAVLGPVGDVTSFGQEDEDLTVELFARDRLSVNPDSARLQEDEDYYYDDAAPSSYPSEASQDAQYSIVDSDYRFSSGQELERTSKTVEEITSPIRAEMYSWQASLSSAQPVSLRDARSSAESAVPNINPMAPAVPGVGIQSMPSVINSAPTPLSGSGLPSSRPAATGFDTVGPSSSGRSAGLERFSPSPTVQPSERIGSSSRRRVYTRSDEPTTFRSSSLPSMPEF